MTRYRTILAGSCAVVALLTLGSSARYTHPAAEPAAPAPRPLPTLRQQAAEQQMWLEKRLTTVLPGIMRQHGIDLWVLSMREYAEDPVFFSMVSPTTFAARRRSISASAMAFPFPSRRAAPISTCGAG